MSISYYDDSREYYSLNTDEKQHDIPAKYLVPQMHIISTVHALYLTIDGLYNAEGEEVPALFLAIKDGIFDITSAQYNEEDEYWEEISA